MLLHSNHILQDERMQYYQYHQLLVIMVKREQAMVWYAYPLRRYAVALSGWILMAASASGNTSMVNGHIDIMYIYLSI